MKTFTLLVTTLLLATSAHASEGTLTSFLDSISGRWDGRGQVQNASERIGYRMDLELAREPADVASWNLHTQANSDSGSIVTQNVAFSVRGDILYVSGEPVRILETSPLSLTYQITRSDFYSGRIYVTTYQAQSDGRTMTGHNTVETNGVSIQDETFTAHHW